MENHDEPRAAATFSPDVHEAAAVVTFLSPLATLRRPALREGNWQLLDCTPAWQGNWTWHCFLIFAWQGTGDERLLVTVNYASNQSQCYVPLPFADLGNAQWRLEDVIGDATYEREGKDLQARGLYLDLSPWRAHVFSLTKLDEVQSRNNDKRQRSCERFGSSSSRLQTLVRL